MADKFDTDEELKQQLKECNAQLKRAALAGKQLLEENHQLGERYDLDMEECNKRIEVGILHIAHSNCYCSHIHGKTMS